MKFTDAGGHVFIGASANGNGSNTAEIEVRDTGMGIPADRLSAIFEPFVQLGRTRVSGMEGTGLGLAISRDLARGMGGDLSVMSEVGVGSTFTLSLRLAEG